MHMDTGYSLGTLAHLHLSAQRSAFLGALLVWVVLSLIALVVLHLSLVAALLGGLLAVALHWLSLLVHQAGHALAAHRTGYPMSGIEFWWVLSCSLYPRDEPALAADDHIQRALGGAPASFLVALVAGGGVLLLSGLGGVLWWAAVCCCLDNLLVLGLGSLVPLGFTDGSTLLYWLKRR
jgi:hypothetical protein